MRMSTTQIPAGNTGTGALKGLVLHQGGLTVPQKGTSGFSNKPSREGRVPNEFSNSSGLNPEGSLQTLLELTPNDVRMDSA